MASHAALAAAATVLATAFAFGTLERYLARGQRHELVWSISLALFALGSLSLWAGAALGWSEWTFKPFYLFGAILNVPYLGLGTVYLLGARQFGDRCSAVVSLLAAFAAGVVVATPLSGPIDPDVLPQGSAVFGPGPRIAAAVASAVPSLVIIGGALGSAFTLARHHRRPAAGAKPALSPGRLALANVLIAVGTLVLGAGGLSNSGLNAMDAFALSLVVGIGLIFAGFLLTSTPAPALALAPAEPWHPPATIRLQSDQAPEPSMN